MVFDKDELKWIEDNRTLIDSGNFKEIFKRSSFGSKLNEAFLELGLNPLQGLDEIPERYFQESGIKNITIPDSITSIGAWAFSWCNYLISITIPDSVTSIGRCAFYGCKAKIIWGNAPTLINLEENEFCGYQGVSLTIPTSVKSIGVSVFFGCNGLKNLIFEGTKEQWGAINKRPGWKRGLSGKIVECTDGIVKIR